MSAAWNGRDQRRAVRVEVLMRVKGRLAAVNTPILVHDLSQTGFAVISEVAFRAGETLDFRLEGTGGSEIAVTAEAVHSRAFPASRPLHLSGFRFVPGNLTGMVPRVLIDRLIEAVSTPPVSCL
jgi:hypothetical protein